MKQFSLLVKPACADCNLRCEYCFYLDHASMYPSTAVHRMSEETLGRMVRSFMALDMPQYAFGWQGGEPTLMGVEFFRTVTDLQQKHGRPGAVVANGLQTNATLITDEFAKHLAEYKFLLGVSLDGPAAFHDTYRLRPDQTGSHAMVMRGIERLQKHNVEFNILVLVSSSNVAHGREIYRYLVDNGFYYHQYIPCVEYDQSGRAMPFSIDGPQWGTFLNDIFDSWYPSDTRRVSIRQFDSIVSCMVDNTRTMCTMGRDCRQYFVVEYNGDIYPCDFFVEPELRLGNIENVSWEKLLRDDTYRQFGRRKREWNPVCGECGFVEFCAGDCPKHRGAGKDAGTLSALCEGWKAFYTHALPGFRSLASQIQAERAAGASPSLSVRQPAAQRNDPCPCGSGKKFKRCCGAIVRAATN